MLKISIEMLRYLLTLSFSLIDVASVCRYYDFFSSELDPAQSVRIGISTIGGQESISLIPVTETILVVTPRSCWVGY